MARELLLERVMAKMETLRVTAQMEPGTVSTCPSRTSRYNGPVLRAGLYRQVVNRYAYAGDLFVGRLVTVAAPDPLAGLIAWVSIEPALRGQGFGAAMHAAVQQDLRIPLLLDMAVEIAAQAVVVGLPPCVKKCDDYPSWGWFTDKVEHAEYLVWDAMVRSENWYVRCFDGRFLVADFLATGGKRADCGAFITAESAAT